MPSATGMSPTALASMGSTGGLIGRSTGTVLHYTRAGDDLLHEDRRDVRASTPGCRTTVRVRHPDATRARVAAPGGSVRPVRSAGRAAGPGSAWPDLGGAGRAGVPFAVNGGRAAHRDRSRVGGVAPSQRPGRAATKGAVLTMPRPALVVRALTGPLPGSRQGPAVVRMH